jgi:hypothetical protein
MELCCVYSTTTKVFLYSICIWKYKVMYKSEGKPLFLWVECCNKTHRPGLGSTFATSVNWTFDWLMLIKESIMYVCANGTYSKCRHIRHHKYAIKCVGLHVKQWHKVHGPAVRTLAHRMWHKVCGPGAQTVERRIWHRVRDPAAQLWHAEYGTKCMGLQLKLWQAEYGTKCVGLQLKLRHAKFELRDSQTFQMNKTWSTERSLGRLQWRRANSYIPSR